MVKRPVSETLKLQNEIILKGIIGEIDKFLPLKTKPRVFGIAEFKDMETIVVQYDKFVGIMEMDPQQEIMVYVAFGINPTGNLEDGNIQLIDMRHTDDRSLWKKANEAFVSLVEDKEPEYIQEIDGKWSSKIIITHIIDTWQLAAEKNRAIIH